MRQSLSTLRQPGPYNMKNNRIQEKMLGILVSHHCNLSCRSCANLSPRSEKFFVSADKVAEDLSVLSKYYHPRSVVLNGGEPLLNPHLLDVIDAVRSSGISDRIQIFTNGILLNRMPEIFWQGIDEICISQYHGHSLGAEELKSCQRQADKHGVYLELHYIDTFREKFSESGTSDSRLVRRIFSTCETAHIWRCHTLYNGYFYRCPQSALIPRVFRPDAVSEFMRDGLKVSDDPDFAASLQNFILSKEPLHSCSNCLGTAGRLFPHSQQSAGSSHLMRRTEEAVYWEQLERLEKSFKNPKRFKRREQIKTLGTRVLAYMPPAVRVSPRVRSMVCLAKRLLG